MGGRDQQEISKSNHALPSDAHALSVRHAERSSPRPSPALQLWRIATCSTWACRPPLATGAAGTVEGSEVVALFGLAPLRWGCLIARTSLLTLCRLGEAPPSSSRNLRAARHGLVLAALLGAWLPRPRMVSRGTARPRVYTPSTSWGALKS